MTTSTTHQGDAYDPVSDVDRLTARLNIANREPREARVLVEWYRENVVVLQSQKPVTQMTIRAEAKIRGWCDGCGDTRRWYLTAQGVRSTGCDCEAPNPSVRANYQGLGSRAPIEHGPSLGTES